MELLVGAGDEVLYKPYQGGDVERGKVLLVSYKQFLGFKWGHRFTVSRPNGGFVRLTPKDTFVLV